MNEVIEFNCETNKLIKRKMTKEEIAQFQKDKDNNDNQILIMQQQKELKISAYKKLGLTDEEIAAII